jgi:hypothetical protein
MRRLASSSPSVRYSVCRRQGEALGVPHDLAHARMAEQVRVDGRRLADPPVA